MEEENAARMRMRKAKKKTEKEKERPPRQEGETSSFTMKRLFNIE